LNIHLKLSYLLIVPFNALANCQFKWCFTGVNNTDDACIACVAGSGEACITYINNTSQAGIILCFSYYWPVSTTGGEE
jgi:hypothetical protein